MDQDVKKVLLGLLEKLDEVCNRHNLRYYIAYGTCLGSLRHKGFIPWDHDIDVLMPVEDAKKLVMYQQEFGERYFVQCKQTDPSFGSVVFKLRDSETACIWNEYKNCTFNQGLNIDIYPYYNAPKTKLGLLFNIWRSYLYRILMLDDMPIAHSGITQVAVQFILFVFRGNTRIRLRERLQRKLASVPEGEYILDYYGEDVTPFSAIMYPKSWFEKPRKMEFEGKIFNGPTQPEKYMTRRYGDYMKLPPLEKRVEAFDQPGVIINAHRSYREYIE